MSLRPPPYDVSSATAYTTYLLSVRREPIGAVRNFMTRHPDFQHVVRHMNDLNFEYWYRRLQADNPTGHDMVKRGDITDILGNQIDQDWARWESAEERTELSYAGSASSRSQSSRVFDWDDGQSQYGRSRNSYKGRDADGASVASSGSRSSRSSRSSRRLAIDGWSAASGSSSRTGSDRSGSRSVRSVCSR